VFCGKVISVEEYVVTALTNLIVVNEILGDHNVDKQMTDSRGDVAYLMADISNVDNSTIKDLYERLESLSSRIMTRILY
jgi:D-3-phosphoglycerate dehydrogenase